MSKPFDAYGQFLRYSVTESAAATLTEGNAILTGAFVGKGGGQGLEIYNILGQVKIPSDSPAATSNESVTGCLSTRSGLSAMPTLDEEHVLYKRSRIIKGGVATYIPLVYLEDDMNQFQVFTPPLLVTHSKIFPYVLSTNASATGDFLGYIFFIYVEIDGTLAIEALEAFR